MDVIHGCIEAATSLDHSRSSLNELIASLALFDGLFAHVRIVAGIQLPIMHLFDELADLWLTLNNLEGSLLVAKREFLKLFSCHNRMLAPELSGCRH